ncbi:MAG TPA: tetratricopeptide repeat protein [Drouetiella sp.]
MVPVNRSLRYLLMLSSALTLASGFHSAAFAADDSNILPPPPLEEDNPKPAVNYDPTRYIQTYSKRTNVSVKSKVVPTTQQTTQVVDSTATTTQTATTTKGGPTTTTTKTIQATPAPEVTTTTQTSQTTTTAVKSEPQNMSFKPTNAAAQVLLNKAYALMKRNDFANAVAQLNAAVRADASSVVARRYLAYALLRVAKPGDALIQLVALTNMMKPYPPTTFDQFNLGESYLLLRNFNAAEESFKQVLTAEPRNDGARGDLIKAYAYDQKFPEAMQQLQIGQQNRTPAIQKYYRDLLELVYNAKTASTVGSAPSTVQAQTEANTWQQISPK